jgi:predicted GH43/DUF377 family glycosyl hydrolase
VRTVFFVLLCIGSAVIGQPIGQVQESSYEQLRIEYSPAEVIGQQEGVMRRDPSDIVQVGDRYYVWYSKGSQASGYDATIWYATSPNGRQWTEMGLAIPKGAQGEWDEHSVFTPNILIAHGKYWLFYTAVPEPFVNKGPNPTKTAIGLAVADSPNGPWDKLPSNPVLKTSDDPSHFDSLRVDDACLVSREGKFWLYYKGRQWNKGPGETKMGVAIADEPGGPYIKHSGNPIIPGNHEVLVWPEGTNIAAMIGTTGPKELTRSIMIAHDGYQFKKTYNVIDVPTAAGAFRPEAFTGSNLGERIEWGLHIRHPQGSLPFLERFDIRNASQ